MPTASILAFVGGIVLLFLLVVVGVQIGLYLMAREDDTALRVALLERKVDRLEAKIENADKTDRADPNEETPTE